MDMTWLQYVANPFALIAVISAIVGLSFRSTINKMKKPSNVLIIFMYGMFLITVLMLGLGSIAIYFLFNSIGPIDVVSEKNNEAKIPHYFSFISDVEAKNNSLQNKPISFLFNSKKNITQNKNIGWIWAGEIANEASDLDQNLQQIKSQTINVKQISEKKIVFTKNKANLRASPPRYSWWDFEYILGDLIEVLPSDVKLEILKTKKIKNQIWLKVKVFSKK